MKRELQCMELRSQDRKIILALEKEMNRMQENLRFAWRLAFVGMLIAGLATGAMLAIAQNAGVF